MSEALARQLAELESASPTELRVGWERAHKHPAPKRASRDLLQRAVAYHIQELAEGGLSKAAHKRLAQLADPKGNHGPPPRPAPPCHRPGTRLIREWGGAVHQVTVGEDGFDYRGARYASLSRIAREITGCPSTISHLARFITRRSAIGHFNEVTSSLVTPRSATRPLSLASEKRECQLQRGTRLCVVDVELQQCPWP